MKYLTLLILLTGCTVETPPPVDNPAGIYSQDMESCQLDPSTPWCSSACKDTSYSWCSK